VSSATAGAISDTLSHIGDAQPSPSSSTKPDVKRQKLDSDDDDMAVKPGRICLVTVGATAGFRQLLIEVLQPQFLRSLSQHGFSLLQVQCGPDFAWFQEQTRSLCSVYGVQIRSFDYTEDMMPHMLQCRGEANVRLPGVVISHAGQWQAACPLCPSATVC